MSYLHPSKLPLSGLAYHKKQAKRLLRALTERDVGAARRVHFNHPRLSELQPDEILERSLKLADARLVVAREARFDSWPKLKSYLESLTDDSEDRRFEAAADAVVTGDEPALRVLLDQYPALAKARSGRPHRATLLHYSAANGIEDHRQLTPANAVAIANVLVESGADIHATAGFYSGGPASTALVALVTSGHPAEAGLQSEMIRAFARSGQSLDGLNRDGLPLAHALLFRYPSGARTLLECGAQLLDAAVAGGVGDLEALRSFVRSGDPPTADPGVWRIAANPPLDEVGVLCQALYLAAITGETEIVRYLLSQGVDLDTVLGHGNTALHEAAWGGYLPIVRLLVEAGARTDLLDRHHRSTPLSWARYAGHDTVTRYLAALGDPSPDG